VREAAALSMPWTVPRPLRPTYSESANESANVQNWPMVDSAGLYHLALTYELADDGRLVGRDLRDRPVPARGEGALYRRIAELADAPDGAIAAAASRYGPLGPVAPIAVADRPRLLWAAGEYRRQAVLDIHPLRDWIATGGTTEIPARLALSAHILAALAETDPVLAQRVVDLSTQGRLSDLPDEEGQQLLQDYGVQQQVWLHGMGRRAHLIVEHLNMADAYVRVIPKPGTERYLALAARYLRVLVTEGEKVGPIAAIVPPDSLGRVFTTLQPDFEENLIAPETVNAWREAATELQTWAARLRAAKTAGSAQISQWKDLLTLHLQEIDAWPYPSGQQLGAFGRALWTVWTRLAQQPPQRRCTWPDHCATLLPIGAHGNREYCDAHRREAARVRSERRRQQARAG
jgi:hypothetical protein